MIQKTLTGIVLVVFLLVALFGLVSLLSHEGHQSGCPLLSAQTVMCSRTVLEHFSMWQMMIAAVLAFAAIGIAFVARVFGNTVEASPERVHSRRYTRTPLRPTLFQCLFSDGILNRKEAYLFSLEPIK